MFLDRAFYAVRVASTGNQEVRRGLQRLAQAGQRCAGRHLGFVPLYQAEAPLRDAHKSGQLDLAESSLLAEIAHPRPNRSHVTDYTLVALHPYGARIGRPLDT